MPHPYLNLDLFGRTIPAGMRARRGFSHSDLEREGQKARLALKYDTRSAIEAFDFLPRIRETSLEGRPVIVEVRQSLENEAHSRFDSSKNTYRIVISKRTHEQLNEGNPRGKNTVVHEWSHIWLHLRVLEHLENLRIQIAAGDARAVERLTKELKAAPRRVSWSCEWQAKNLTGALLMPASGIHLIEEQGGSVVEKMQQHFGVSAEAARVRYAIYCDQKSRLLTADTKGASIEKKRQNMAESLHSSSRANWRSLSKERPMDDEAWESLLGSEPGAGASRREEKLIS